MHIAIDRGADTHGGARNRDASHAIEPRGVDPRVDVAEERTEIDDEITALHEVANFIVDKGAAVHAAELRMRFIERRLVHPHGREGQTRTIDKLHRLRTQTEAHDNGADKHTR